MSSAAEKDLSVDQREVLAAALSWTHGEKVETCNDNADFISPEICTLGGLAGTGKTTVLGVLAATLQKEKRLVAYVTFTGRASSILKRKLAAHVRTTNLLKPSSKAEARADERFFDSALGEHSGPPFCGTIHRLLFRPIVDSKTEELLGFAERDALDRKYNLIVVDEASMLSDEMLTQLSKFSIPILAVGDHGQLPPVMTTSSVLDNCDLRLEKIHRQAAHNPIIKVAHAVRNTGVLRRKLHDGEHVVFAPKETALDVARNAWANSQTAPLDIGVLCWMNRTRINLNGLARQAMQFNGPPRDGEIVIALRNAPPIYNGMRGLLTTDTASGAKPWLLKADIEFPDDEIPSSSYLLNAAQFGRERPFESVEQLRERGIDVRSMKAAGDSYDFGYAATVHKFQGSQLKHAIVYLDRAERPYDDDWRRWAYTAVTRASERLTVLV